MKTFYICSVRLQLQITGTIGKYRLLGQLENTDYWDNWKNTDYWDNWKIQITGTIGKLVTVLINQFFLDLIL